VIVDVLEALLDIGVGCGNAPVLLLERTLEGMAQREWRVRRLGEEAGKDAVQTVLLNLVRTGPRRGQPNAPATVTDAMAYLKVCLERVLITIWRREKSTVPWPERTSTEGRPSEPVELPSAEGRADPEARVALTKDLAEAERFVFEVLAQAAVEKLKKSNDREGRRQVHGQLEAMYRETCSRDDLVRHEIEATGKSASQAYAKIQKAHKRARIALADAFDEALREGRVPPDLERWVRMLFARLAERRLGERKHAN
jgi:hypothetical protein